MQLHDLLYWHLPRRLWRDPEGFAHTQRSCVELLLRDLLGHLLLLVLDGLDGGLVLGASGGNRGAMCDRVRPWQPAIINKIIFFFVCLLYVCKI